MAENELKPTTCIIITIVPSTEKNPLSNDEREALYTILDKIVANGQQMHIIYS